MSWIEIDGDAKAVGAELCGASDASIKEAIALIARLDPGSYSAQVTGATSATGVALVEVYDAADTLNATRLINLSTRGEVGTLDYAEPAAPTWSVGRAVALSELALTGLASYFAAAAILPSVDAALADVGAQLERRVGGRDDVGRKVGPGLRGGVGQLHLAGTGPGPVDHPDVLVGVADSMNVEEPGGNQRAGPGLRRGRPFTEQLHVQPALLQGFAAGSDHGGQIAAT